MTATPSIAQPDRINAVSFMPYERLGKKHLRAFPVKVARQTPTGNEPVTYAPCAACGYYRPLRDESDGTKVCFACYAERNGGGRD